MSVFLPTVRNPDPGDRFGERPTLRPLPRAASTRAALARKSDAITLAPLKGRFPLMITAVRLAANSGAHPEQFGRMHKPLRKDFIRDNAHALNRRQQGRQLGLVRPSECLGRAVR